MNEACSDHPTSANDSDASVSKRSSGVAYFVKRLLLLAVVIIFLLAVMIIIGAVVVNSQPLNDSAGNFHSTVESAKNEQIPSLSDHNENDSKKNERIPSLSDHTTDDSNEAVGLTITESNMKFLEEHEESIFESLLISAREGDAESQWMVGLRYYNDADFAEAVKWFTNGALQGNAACQASLGECYYYGLGVSQDYSEAVKWLKQAARQDNYPAITLVGRCYQDGTGVSQNSEKAYRCFKLSALQGQADAQSLLAGCYYEGAGVLQDYSEAAMWHLAAALQGHQLSQYLLSVQYILGEGIGIDYVEGYAWHVIATRDEREFEFSDMKPQLSEVMTEEQISIAHVRAKELENEIRQNIPTFRIVPD